MNTEAEIQRSLGRIEGKLDSLSNTVATHVADDTYNFKEAKTRISTLEKKMWIFLGAIAVLTGYPAISHGISVALAAIK